MPQQLIQADVTDILSAFERSDFARLRLFAGPLRVEIDRTPEDGGQTADALEGAVAVSSPLLGVFEAASEPVQRGVEVQQDTMVGFIRVMEKRTAVRAGLRGQVAAVSVRDGDFVEYGQTLLHVYPAEGEGRQ